MDDALRDEGVQATAQVASTVRAQLDEYLAPLLVWLDCQMDARLVRTVADGIAALLQWRNRAHGLLLSELGGYVLTPAQAPAGTKRVSNLLRSAKWAAGRHCALFVGTCGDAAAGTGSRGRPALLIWDTSVLEKPESLASPDLGSVRSSKARRLTQHQAGVLPAAQSSALCARLAVARVAVARPQRAARGRDHALVE